MDAIERKDVGKNGVKEQAPPVPKVAGQDREKKPRSKDVVVEGQFEDLDFSDMELSDEIVKGLRLCRYDKPTPIQLRAIPLGKLNDDLLLQAKSGTGKTCVFTVCILQQIVVTDLRIQALVVAPCREIAVQICNVIESIGAFKDGLKVKVFIGGTSVSQSIRRTTNCHIAVGTPGRLAHMVSEYNMDLSQVKVVALDEADELVNPSFFEDIKKIFKALPSRKQMIATSATYSETVIQFLEKFMRKVYKIQLDLDNPILCGVDQYVINVKKLITGGKVKGASENEVFDMKMKCLLEIMRRISYKQAIIFSNYQLRAEKIFEELRELQFDIDLLSGARSQEDRLLAFKALQQGKVKALVATDVASRGIDIEGVDIIINFDIPLDNDTYVHRVGRAGRFGAPGKALTICYHNTDLDTLGEYQASLHFTLWVIETLDELVGINIEKNKFKPTKQLKGEGSVDWFSMDKDDEEALRWKETCDRIFTMDFKETQTLEYSAKDSGWTPKMSGVDIKDNLESELEEFKRKIRAKSNEDMESVDEEGDETVLGLGEDEFSSPEELEEEEGDDDVDALL